MSTSGLTNYSSNLDFSLNNPDKGPNQTELAIRQLRDLDPSDFNKFNIVSISLTLGKFFIVTVLSKSKVAANIGKDEFLLPEIKTFPLILQGP